MTPAQLLGRARLAPRPANDSTAQQHFSIRIDNQLNALIDRPSAARVARRFAVHLAVEFPAVFTFLLEPDAIDATNRRAEHALRPAVVARKVCGGNRTDRGAETHAVLASVLRTIQQRHLDVGEVFSGLLRSSEPITALAPPPRT